MRIQFVLKSLLVLAGLITVSVLEAESQQFIGADALTGSSQAVVVDDIPLIHTAQLVPRTAQGQLPASEDATAQSNLLLHQMETAIVAAGGSADRILKLNVYLAKLEARESVESALAKHFSHEKKPAISYVVTPLPHEHCLVAMDAVGAAASLTASQVTLQTPTGLREAQTAILPAGSRIYIAGQAEKGATLAEATRRTLQSLRATLQFLGRQDSDIVQLKSFLSPMADVAEAQREMASFFGERSTPPTVWVEWTAPLIEIELIAWGGVRNQGPAVEFLTPPGMTASPVYSKVTRTNSDRLIYLPGLFARQPTDAAGEVTDVFGQLTESLQLAGSDLRHLVKATYYCSTNDTSAKLNELRPKYYDPTRPPSASKAIVKEVGKAHRAVTIDMIAVPKN